MRAQKGDEEYVGSIEARWNAACRSTCDDESAMLSALLRRDAIDTKLDPERG